MAKRQSTIGTNPLEAVVPTAAPEPKPTKPAPEDKARISFQFNASTIDKLRDLAASSATITMAGFVEESVLSALADYERENGTIPARSAPPKPGRRVT